MIELPARCKILVLTATLFPSINFGCIRFVPVLPIKNALATTPDFTIPVLALNGPQ